MDRAEVASMQARFQWNMDHAADLVDFDMSCQQPPSVLSCTMGSAVSPCDSTSSTRIPSSATELSQSDSPNSVGCAPAVEPLFESSSALISTMSSGSSIGSDALMPRAEMTRDCADALSRAPSDGEIAQVDRAVAQHREAMRHCGGWDSHMFSVLTAEEISSARHELVDSTWSEAFAGISSASAALKDTIYSLNHCLPPELRILAPRCLHTTEWEPHLAPELMSSHSGEQTCNSSDLASFWSPVIQSQIPRLKKNPKRTMEELMPKALQPRGHVRFKSWCSCHGEECPVVRTDRHISGFPCTPHSSLGPGTNTEDVCMFYVLAWAALCRALHHPLILVENVPGIEYLLRILFAGMYTTGDSAIISPLVLGQDVERDREFFCLASINDAASHVRLPLSRFVPRFHRKRKGSMDQYYWIHHYDHDDPKLRPLIRGELQKELQWARARPTSWATQNRCTSSTTMRHEEFGVAAHYRDPSPFEMSLNQMELKFLAGYRAKNAAANAAKLDQGDPLGTCNLQNNPEKRNICNMGVSATRSNRPMHTMVKSMHLQWVDRSPAHGGVAKRHFKFRTCHMFRVLLHSVLVVFLGWLETAS